MWWDKQIFIAKRIGTEVDDYGNVTVLFDEPTKHYENVMPIGQGDTRIQAYGERIHHMRKGMFGMHKWYGKIEEGDLAYLDGRTPEGETVHGERANYRTVSVEPQNLRIAVYFEKLQKGV